MKSAPIPLSESNRLRALYALGILDTKPNEYFDRITRVARDFFKVKVSTVSFVDKDRVWCKSAQGLEVDEVDRDISFCGHTICQKVTSEISSRICEVPDARLDPRFEDNPLVINEPNVRYYMGFVLQSSSKENIGTLCIVDTRPRTFSDKEKMFLADLGLMLEDKLSEIKYTAEFSIKDISIASKAVSNIFNEIDKALKTHGIGIREWRMLDIIVQSDFTTPSKISKKLDLAPSAVSKSLELLESNGLIYRNNLTDQDRRIVKLKCNERGQEVWRFGNTVSNRVVKQLCNT